MANILTTLLKMPGIGVNIPDKKGRTPLSWASGNGRIKTVEVLLEVTAVDKESIDNDKRTAISWACGGGHYTVLLKLLDGCPGVAVEDIDGWPPLAWAIQTDSADTFQALLDSKKVQLEGRDRSGQTALT
jgi:ankyrin repeat protein